MTLAELPATVLEETAYQSKAQLEQGEKFNCPCGGQTTTVAASTETDVSPSYLLRHDWYAVRVIQRVPCDKCGKLWDLTVFTVRKMSDHSPVPVG